MKSLGTGDLAEANRLKHAIVAEFKRRIELLAKGRADPLAAAREAALAFRVAMASADNERLSYNDQESAASNELLDVINEEAEALLEAQGPEASRLFRGIASGRATLIEDHYPTWLAQVQATAQTKSLHTSALKRYITWAGAYITIEDTGRRRAGEYVSSLLTVSGLSRKTVRRHLSSLSSFWLWLMGQGLAPNEPYNNPWRGHQLGKKPKGVFRNGLSDEVILKLLKAHYSTDRYAVVIADLLRLGLLTGARLDELCALERSDVEKDSKGYWINIREGKTDAAARRVPIHKAGAGIIKRRLADKDQYLFAGLIPGGPDRKRSWNVSKAYGRFRKHAGVSERGQDFHALRTTFMSRMEGLGIPESTTKLLVGHVRESMTYGYYSQGELVRRREAISKLKFNSAIMTALTKAPS